MVVFKRSTLASTNIHHQQCHVEYYFKNPITVFKEEEDNQSTTQLSFAANIASFKTLCTDNEPFYVMEVGRVKRMVELWFHMLPRVKPFYSVNCNSDPVLLRLLSEHPLVGFNCTTSENLQNALEVTTNCQVLYSNSCLSRGNLYQAAISNVNLITFQSGQDLKRVMCYTPEAKLILNVCVNPDSEDPNALLGCAREEAFGLLQMAAMVGAQCVGIAFNVGSDCFRPGMYAEAIAYCAELFEMGNKMHPYNLFMNVLNIGGGFASQGIQANNYMKFQEICDHINMSLEDFFPPEKFPELQVIATPGRFFAGSAYSLITNIIDRRPVDASTITNSDFDCGNEAFLYQINDGYYGSFGCKVVANCEPTCTPLFNDDLDAIDAEHVYGNVLGPLGFESDFDVVQTGVKFRPLYVGDWLIWSNMGAYTFNNCGSLDDEAECHSPTVFYFSSGEDWEHLTENAKRRNSLLVDNSGDTSDGMRVLTVTSDDAQKFTDEDEGIGSCHTSSAGEEELRGDDCEFDSSRSSHVGEENHQKDGLLSAFGWPLYD